MKKVLIADSLPEKCVKILQDAGLEVDNKPGLPPQELKEAVRDASGVICRSGAKLTAEVLENAERLEAICRAGVGVDNIDLNAASSKGVVVMNTPGANALSTAEHTFALMLGLARNIGPAYLAMRQGKWDRKRFMGSQLAGATLGVIGLGRVGLAVAKRAVAFQMRVLAYDPYISKEVAQKAGVEIVDGLQDMLPQCDYLTVHVPESDETRALIGEEQIQMMKPGARIINCARGSVVDQKAVEKAIQSGHLAGAAFDVYIKEPPEDFRFACDDRILATPHLGASTDAAQLAVAQQAAEQLVAALTRHEYRNAVNATFLPAEEMKALEPYCELARQLGRTLAQLNRGRPQSVRVSCKGEIADWNVEPIVNYALMGILQTMMGTSVNVVSTPHLARERGVSVTASTTHGLEAGYTNLVEVELVTDKGELGAAGTLFGTKHARIVRIGPFYMEIVPEGDLLMVFCKDRPGLVGYVGETLGAAGINIARMAFGREQKGGNALVALNVDCPTTQTIHERLLESELVERVCQVSL